MAVEWNGYYSIHEFITDLPHIHF